MLTLYNVTEAESGEYICKVSNYIGEANQSAWLTVTRPMAEGKRGERHCGGLLLGPFGPSWWIKPNSCGSPVFYSVSGAISHGKILGRGQSVKFRASLLFFPTC